ncbi:SwmB domain-containing protein [Paenibacillus pabuli]|uniref:SwmB domain-containing protein n=1 Tax=Paenibacillus pabuli TaxID=1472 RepID=UPI000783F991|nr:SwmB domain-containing protein [Paenibacillus pabuli]MEC0129235.1 SwmB domain-containing protein [Paenibacillus pabuli]
MSLKRIARSGMMRLLIVLLTVQGLLVSLVGMENTAYALDDLTTLGVTSTVPTLGANYVNGTAPLEIEFDRPVQKSDGSTNGYISIKRLADDKDVIDPIKVNGTDSTNIVITSDDAAVPGVGKKVIINHAPLPGGTYYVQIDANSFVYADGSNTAFPGLDKQWTFRTQGVGSSSIINKYPRNAATQVPPDSNLIMHFEKNVSAGSGSLLVYQGSLLHEEIPVTSDRIKGMGTTTITVDPKKTWNNNSTYFIVFPEGFLRDEQGNDIEGLKGTDWGFNVGVISDPTALTVSTLSPENGATSASLTGELTVTFNKELDPNYRGNATLKKENGAIVASTTTINASDNKQLRIVPSTALDSNTTYSIDIPGNVFRDKAGNIFAGLNGSRSWSFKTLSKDTTPPVLKSTKMYSNNTIRLTYDEWLSNIDPITSTYAVTVNGEKRNVSTAYISGDSVYVVLDTGVAVGQVVRIAYTPGTGNRAVTDQSQNAAASFSARDVENTLDSVMSKPREGNVYYSTISLYYPETVYVNSSDAVRQFTVTADGASVGINSISVNSSSLVTLNLSRSITDGEVVRVAYTPGSWPVKDSRGQALAGFSGFYIRNTIDTKAPVFQSAEVSGSKMWVRYNEPLNTLNKPLKSQYSVLVDGKAVFVNDITIEDDLVALTLASSVTNTQNVTLSYVPGALRLTDLNGNPAGYINLAPVTYTSGTGLIKSASVQGDTVTITFRNALQSQTALTTSQFNVQIGGSTAGIISAASSGTTVTIKLSNTVTAGQTGTINYVPGAIPIRDQLNVGIEAFGPLALQQNGDAAAGTGSTNTTLPSWLTVSDTSTFNKSMYVMSKDAAVSSSASSRNSRSTHQFNVDASKLNQAFQYAGLSNNASRLVVFEVPSSESAAYVGFPIDTLAEIAARERFSSIGVRFGDRLWSVPLSDLNISTISQSLGTSVGSGGSSYLYVQLESVPITISGTMDGMLASAGAQRVSEITDVYLSAYNGYSGQRVEQQTKSQLALRLPSTTSGAVTGLVYIDQGTSSLANIPHTFSNAAGAVMVTGQLSGNQTVVAASHPVSYRDTASHWAKDVIGELSAKWIINGQNGTLYVPDQQITRAEFATLVAKGLGLPGDYSSAQQFRDVRYGDISGAYIGAAAKAGIITGNTDGTFRPDHLITREQMAIMMVRALDYGGQPTVLKSSAASTLSKFKDNKKIQSKDAVAKAVQEGIIQGMTSKTFEPQGNATRAQAAVMLKRVLDTLGYL